MSPKKTLLHMMTELDFSMVSFNDATTNNIFLKLVQKFSGTVLLHPLSWVAKASTIHGEVRLGLNDE